MNHPPDINVPLHPVLVTREPVDTLRHQHSQLHTGRHSNGLCDHRDRETSKYTHCHEDGYGAEYSMENRYGTGYSMEWSRGMKSVWD